MAKELLVDEEKIKKSIQSGIPLTITTFTLPREIELYVEQVITVFLKFIAQEKIKDYIIYCVQELMGNAKKANTKRVYFSEHGLELSNPDHYKKGMAAFKEQALGNAAHYLQLQKQQGLYIKVILRMKNNIFYIEIRNNSAITKTELIRIHDKLARSRKYNSLEDALNQVLDDSEGAGLGIVILILMLKKMGLDDDCFDILTTEKETIARLTLPLDKARTENIQYLSSTIVESINSLPQFPENVLLVQRLISDPKSKITDIAQQISMDPALTADLLRTVNSALYMLTKKTDNISDAVKMLGMQGIRNLLYSYGTQKLLKDDSQNQKALWEHSHKVGFYAFNIFKNLRKDHTLLDDVFVGGILHDMGKIVFSAVHPDLLQKIRNFCVEKSLPSSTFEDFAAGMNHAEIGGRIAEKWNFPDSLIACVKYHHSPESAPKEFQDIVDTVYLANIFCLYENGDVNFDQLESGVLERFGITTKKHIDVLVGKLSEGFLREKAK
ncbi:MAG: HDOD domain-containing protein [Treponema sp.]|nr:HDOD domain-containing protein [Treponema sp.]